MVRFARPGTAAAGSSTLLDATTALFRSVASSTDCCSDSIRPWMYARWEIVSLSLLAFEAVGRRELFNPPRQVCDVAL